MEITGVRNTEERPFHLISCQAITPEYHYSLSVSRNKSKPARFRPMQHSVCTKGRQYNLLMGSRGRRLPILSISIRQNCWLLLHTHITISFFLWHTLKCILSAVHFRLKMLHPVSLHTHTHTHKMSSMDSHGLVSLIPHCAFLWVKRWKWEHGRKTIQLTSRAEQSFVNKSLISFTLLKTSLIVHFF